MAEVFGKLLTEQPRPGHVNYLNALVSSVRNWPDVPKELRDDAERAAGDQLQMDE